MYFLLVLNKFNNKMELIDKKQYKNESLIDKRYFLHRSTKDNEIFYIFKIEKLLDDNPIKYKTIRQYYFCIPNDILRNKCYCYEGGDKIEFLYNDKLFQISENEYLDLFRKFIKNDGEHKDNVNLGIEN